MMFNDDPLKFTYLVVQEDDKLDEVSPFQGFGSSWPSTLWALRFLTLAPSSFLERGLPLDYLQSLRIGGAGSLKWTPLWISALEQVQIDNLGFCVVICSGTDAVAARVDAWRVKQPRLTLHLRSGQFTSDEQVVKFFDTGFREHCREILDSHGHLLSPERRQAALSGLEKWLVRPRTTDTEVPRGHNTTLPNELVLLRADRDLPAAGPFMGKTEQEYDQLAVRSAMSVLKLREQVEFRPVNRLHIPKPGLLLTEPALFRSAYRAPSRKNSVASGPALDAVRFLQQQNGLYNEFHPEKLAKLLRDHDAKAVIAARQRELDTHFHGVGLMAAQTFSAVLRMRPSINRVFPTLKRYAQNVRAENYSARVKSERLFGEVQKELLDAIGPDRHALISSYIGPNQNRIRCSSGATPDRKSAACSPTGLLPDLRNSRELNDGLACGP